LQGRKLTNTIELNPAGGEAGNPVCAADPTCSSFNNFITHPETFRYPQTYVPFGGTTPQLQFGSVGQYATFVNSHYNALQVTADKKLTHGLTFRATYSYSHSLDGSSSFEDLGFSGVRGLDPFNPKANYGDSAFDARHRFVVSYAYDLPSVRKFGAFRAIPSRVVDGWRIAGINTLQSGIPVTVGSSALGSGTCDAAFEFFSCWDRPNLVAPIKIFNPRSISVKGKTNYWFDPSSFQEAPVGLLGNAGRNFFHGPGINNFDLALLKETRITERTHVELRFEVFNVFNHAQFSINAVHSDSNTGSFGKILSARNPYDSRIIQLGGKFVF
jgi:hypothetical protein